MTYINAVTFKDTAQIDAFGNLKVSQAEPIFDSMSEFDNTFLWENKTNGGTVAQVANQNAMRLSTAATTSGNYAYRTTRQYMRYKPGRSLNIETTFVMSATATNSYARIGYFDANNGIFLERNTGASTTTVYITRRTFVTGSAADNQVAQTAWNVDKLDGTGVSGKTLDLTKSNILFIQLQYLGVGRVQVGFVIDGVPCVAHEFKNAGVLSTVYMSTGCLPVRGEVQNSGTSSGTLTMDMICTTVYARGKGAETLQFAASNGITAKTTGTTFVPLVSLRAATKLGGSAAGTVTNKGVIRPIGFSILVTGQIHEFAVYYNSTLTTAVSYAAVNALSLADVDVAATAFSAAGTLFQGGYLAASASTRDSVAEKFMGALPLVYATNGAAAVQDNITIMARTVTGSGTAYASIFWLEEF